MDVPPQRIDAIRAGEANMARRIALAYEVHRPTPTWTALIPFRFIFDAIRREREVGWSKARYLPPREKALAQAAGVEEAPAAPSGAGQEMVARLVRHYEPMLRAEGKDYAELLKAAYPRPVELEAEFRDIAELEAGVDEVALYGQVAGGELATQLEAYRHHAEEQRARLVQEIYYA